MALFLNQVYKYIIINKITKLECFLDFCTAIKFIG